MRIAVPTGCKAPFLGAQMKERDSRPERPFQRRANRSAGETVEGVDAQYTMPDQIGVDDVRLQFIRQLYDESLERHGAHHMETRLLSDYLSSFSRPSNMRAQCAAAAGGGEMARAEQ
jgi:hypothetical protein